MVATHISPAQILDTYRKSDAVIIVCQNNTKKIIEIAAINDEASRITGYSNEDLLNQPLAKILPERIAEKLAEFVEFEEDKNDLQTVLGKIADFSIILNNGQEMSFKLRMIRGELFEQNPWFHLVLLDENKIRKNNAFKDMLKENFKGHEVIHPATGLPDRGSLLKDLELIIYSVRNDHVTAIFALIDINNYEELLKKYGLETCHKLQEHIGRICKLKLRSQDTVCTMSDSTLGLLLIDAPESSARMVLNRLRWTIGVSSMPIAKDELSVQVTIGFAPITGKMDQGQLLEKCEEFIKELRNKTGNSVHSILLQERRASPDRRKQNISVAVDRRKGDRRKEKDS